MKRPNYRIEVSAVFGFASRLAARPPEASQAAHLHGLGTTKNRRGRTFKYVHVTEFKDVIDVQHKEHEALKKADDLPVRLPTEREARQELAEGVERGL